jgi:LacI family transcriptional regulator
MEHVIGGVFMRLKDIADEAGVSISTVSRVINNPDLVRPETVEVVRKVLNKYNYFPKKIYNQINDNFSKQICIFSNNILHHHFASTAYILDDMFFNLGYNSILCSTTDSIEKMKQHFKLISERHVDGIVLLGSVFSIPEVENAMEVYFPDIPIVISNGYLAIPNSHSILIDHKYGIKKAISFLIEKGHERIGLVHSRVTFNAKRKIDAFHEIMNEHNLTIKPNSIFYTDISIEGGIAVANQFIDQKCDCTALIFLDDIVAVSAMNQFRRKGLAVPDDIAIIGHDNSQLSKCSYPSLTTIDGKSELLANVLGNTLHNLLSNKPVGNTIMISPELIIREST